MRFIFLLNKGDEIKNKSGTRWGEGIGILIPPLLFTLLYPQPQIVAYRCTWQPRSN